MRDTATIDEDTIHNRSLLDQSSVREQTDSMLNKDCKFNSYISLNIEN